MKNILIVKPCFSDGNIGDEALIKTIIHLFKSDKIFIPQSKHQLNSTNITKFTLLIYFGNDCVPYYPSCIPIKQIIEFLKANKKVYIINTSWGVKLKNTNIIKSIASDPNFYIYMRDKYSHKLIQQDIKFHNTPILTADLAFLCKKNTNNKNPDLEKWLNKSNKPIIGINTHNDFNKYNKLVKNELRKFIIDNKDKYRFLFIPHDTRKKEYEDLKSICNSCKNIDGYTTKYLDPEYEKYITSKLFIVITGRMHLSILTIPNEIPCIAIAYNGLKAKGTFEHWGLEDYVIEPKTIHKIHKKVKYIEKNYKIIQDMINKNKNKVNELIENYLLTLK